MCSSFKNNVALKPKLIDMNTVVRVIGKLLRMVGLRTPKTACRSRSWRNLHSRGMARQHSSGRLTLRLQMEGREIPACRRPLAFAGWFHQNFYTKGQAPWPVQNLGRREGIEAQLI